MVQKFVQPCRKEKLIRIGRISTDAVHFQEQCTQWCRLFGTGNDGIKTHSIKRWQILTHLICGNLQQKIATGVGTCHMEITGIDDHQITFGKPVFFCLDNGRKFSMFQIENFYVFMPVCGKNKGGCIQLFKTDMQQISFVYCFVKAGFHKYLRDIIEISVNYNQKTK